MLENFITSALVIDDDRAEVDSLIEYLEEKDIWTKYYHPDDLEGKKKPFNNRRLIFLDLYLKNKLTSIDNIALIRRYFKHIIGNDFGTYGIVLWTKHATNHLNEFCDKIHQSNNPFSAPLFVIALEKNKYKTQGNYDGVLEELEEELKNNISSSFFLEWNKSVKQGADNTIGNLYQLFEDYKQRDKNLEAVLHSLACNYTGIPKENREGYDLQRDLVKSLTDVLQVEVSERFQKIDHLFAAGKEIKFDFAKEKEEKTKVFAGLNTLLLLDFQNLHQNHPIPGNVYKIHDPESPLYILDKISLKKEIDLTSKESLKRIILDVTPPCDFAQAKKQQQSRIIGGIMLDYDQDLINKKFRSDNFYSSLHPVTTPSEKNPQMIIFDFYRFQTLSETELEDEKKYPVFFRTRNPLFADILQKLSAHTARLGIAIMHP